MATRRSWFLDEPPTAYSLRIRWGSPVTPFNRCAVTAPTSNLLQHQRDGQPCRVCPTCHLLSCALTPIESLTPIQPANGSSCRRQFAVFAIISNGNQISQFPTDKCLQINQPPAWLTVVPPLARWTHVGLVVRQVRRGLQLQSLWRTPAAAVREHVFSAYSCCPYGVVAYRCFQL